MSASPQAARASGTVTTGLAGSASHPAENTPLYLDASARIFRDADSLRIVHRRGHFVLRGKNVSMLHERLAPLLEKGVSRDRILNQLGKGSPIVARYLDGMLEAGALITGRTCSGLSRDFPTPDTSTQVVRSVDPEIAVQLDAQEFTPGSPIEVCFVTRATLARWIFQTDWEAISGRRMWVVCNAFVDDRELFRRAAIARYLIANEYGRGGAPVLRVFQLDERRLTLRSLAQCHPPEISWTQLAAQLGLVRLLDVPQLPLVAWIAELHGSGESLVAYGLSSEDVAHTIGLTLAGHEALRHAAQNGSAAGWMTSIGDKGTSRTRVQVSPGMADRAVFASTRQQCIHDCLSSWAVETPNDAGTAVDLLSMSAPSRRSAILQDALRQRRESLWGTLDEHLDPLFVFRGGGISVARIGLEETLYEALARALIGEFASEASTRVTCIARRRPANRLARDLRLVRMHMSSCMRVILGRISVCGTVIHYAIPMPGRSSDAEHHRPE